MDVALNDLELYPELKTFTLVNVYTNDERTVTENQMIEAFGRDEYIKIKSGRNENWMLID